MSPERLMTILIGPHVSEKATVIAEKHNQVAFVVRKDANKREVKKAVEHLFDVKVDEVRILNQKGKTKRFGQTKGKRSDWKKAYVRLAEGHDIDFAGLE